MTLIISNKNPFWIQKKTVSMLKLLLNSTCNEPKYRKRLASFRNTLGQYFVKIELVEASVGLPCVQHNIIQIVQYYLDSF